MSLTENNGGMVMPVSPLYGGGYGGSGSYGFGGENGWWIILLFLFALGGWGNGFGGNGGGNMMSYVTNADVQRGFDQQTVLNSVAGIQNGVYGLGTQMCNGFAGVNATVNAGFANAETAANARQIANMNQAFGAQTAMMQGFNNIGTQFANYCGENRLGIADLKYTVATENCADRAAASENTRDIIAAISNGVQSIKDDLFQEKLEAKNDLIAQLRQEILFARGQSSQNVQTATIQQQLMNELRSCPIPAQPVYGATPIFQCNSGGCGCNGGMA